MFGKEEVLLGKRARSGEAIKTKGWQEEGMYKIIQTKGVQSAK